MWLENQVCGFRLVKQPMCAKARMSSASSCFVMFVRHMAGKDEYIAAGLKTVCVLVCHGQSISKTLDTAPCTL